MGGSAVGDRFPGNIPSSSVQFEEVPEGHAPLLGGGVGEPVAVVQDHVRGGEYCKS